jgi:hypothetical protein
MAPINALNRYQSPFPLDCNDIRATTTTARAPHPPGSVSAPQAISARDLEAVYRRTEWPRERSHDVHLDVEGVGSAITRRYPRWASRIAAAPACTNTILLLVAHVAFIASFSVALTRNGAP